MDQKEKDRQEMLKMINDPNTWGLWPLLPMKKVEEVGERPKFGFLLAIEKPIIFLTNFMDLRDLGMTTVKEVMENIPGKEYGSFDAILDDGWVID